MASDDKAAELAEQIYGISVEAEHNRGPEWCVEVIAALLRPHLSASDVSAERGVKP